LIGSALNEIVKVSKNWDGDVVTLQVTDAKESTIELRCLMNARAAGQVFKLRCGVRGQLIDFLQKQHPEALPRQRSEVAVSNVANAQTAEAKVVRQAAASGAQCWAMLHCMVAFA
jgi:hypothetical protein